MASKGHKKKRDRYTLLLVPESGDAPRQFRISAGKLKALLAAILVLVFALLVYVSYALTSIRTDGSLREALSRQVEQLTEENAALKEKNEEIGAELDAKKAEDAAGAKAEEQAGRQEQEEALGGSAAQEDTAALPSGFPLNGAATITANFGDAIESPDGEGETRVRNGIAFHVDNGTSIVSSGGGSIVYAGEDDDKEGFLVKVDHGNGYVSCYHNASPIKVKEGDTVSKGAVLYTVEGDNGTLGYEILKDGGYIDPMSVMEVNG